MAVITTLAACNTNPALNGPDGAVDLPSTLDDAIRYALSFIAQLRDGAAIPIGAFFQLPTLTAPTGFVKMNGALLSRTTYANLFAFASGYGLVSEANWTAGQYGCFSVGDGSTTFRIPDLRGMFVRGLDESRGIDTSRNLGVFQDHMLLQHNHATSESPHAHTAGDYGHGHTGLTDVAGNHAHGYTAPGSGLENSGSFFSGLGTAGATTDAAGNHQHGLLINVSAANVYVNGAYTGLSIQNAGGAEYRVKNLAYPFYMRY